MRPIDADALIKAINQTCSLKVVSLGNLVDIIGKQPTIDAVPVVRCRDCKWWTKQEKSIQGRCALAGIYPTGSWYCGNGGKERR